MAGLNDAFKKYNQGLSKPTNQVLGNLGILISGVPTVSIYSRPNYVYVRLTNLQSELVQAYNDVVTPVYDLPVVLEWNGSYYVVIKRDVKRYSNWGATPSVPLHAHQHEYDPANNGGGDLMWVRSQNFYPLAMSISGTSQGPNIVIAPYTYNWQGTWIMAGNTGTASLLPAIPSAGYARMVLIYLDGPTGNPMWISGSQFAETLTKDSDAIANLPPFTPSVGIPLGAVRLLSSTTAIAWNQLYDLRQFYGRDLPKLTPGMVTGSFVASFNGRTGTVIPQQNDYSGFYAPTGSVGGGGMVTGAFVASFNGRTGTVIPQQADYSGFYAPSGSTGGMITGAFVASFNGRTGTVLSQQSDYAGFYQPSGSPVPATTVTDETTWGIGKVAGSSLLYARQDHTHGSPVAPVLSFNGRSGTVLPQVGDYSGFFAPSGSAGSGVDLIARIRSWMGF